MEFLKDIYFFREILLPAIDIFVVYYLVYRVYLVIAETRAIAALKGIILIVAVTLAANFSVSRPWAGSSSAFWVWRRLP